MITTPGRIGEVVMTKQELAVRLGALRRTIDERRIMRCVSYRFVGQDAVEGDPHADAWLAESPAETKTLKPETAAFE